jgi:hypothetical protein
LCPYIDARGGGVRACWDIIKSDIHSAFHQLFHLDARGLRKINTSLIVLIPKKDGADTLHDFRPISLIHSIVKLFTKVLALRLAPKLDEMVAQCQSAFIKNRCIQENFLYVQNTTQFFHKTRKLAILLKLDLAKAFDSVSWTYLLDMLRARGFGERWREWMAMLFASIGVLASFDQWSAVPIHPSQTWAPTGGPLVPFLVHSCDGTTSPHPRPRHG